MGAAPFHFHCPVARRNRVPGSRRINGRTDWVLPGGHRVRRTGRTKLRGHSGGRRDSHRTLDTMYEYECSCGHVGWSAHKDMLQKPVIREDPS